MNNMTNDNFSGRYKNLVSIEYILDKRGRCNLTKICERDSEKGERITVLQYKLNKVMGMAWYSPSLLKKRSEGGAA